MAGAIAGRLAGDGAEGRVRRVLAIPLMILGGFVAGMLWALIPALLKVQAGGG